MEALPDDALLAVLQHLALPDLRRCRLVCRRLGDLVAHPDLWTRRDIAGADLALGPPCCRRLRLKHDDLLRHGALAVDTECAASHLELHVDRFPMMAESVVGRQAAFGRLRKLTLVVEASRWPSGFRHLSKFVVNVEGLHELELRFHKLAYMGDVDVNSLAAVAPASLRRLWFDGPAGALLKVLLRAHASTLRDVILFGAAALDDEVAGLLRAIRHRWCLAGPFVRGMDKLLGCRRLSHLRLVVPHSLPTADLVGAARLCSDSVSRLFLYFETYSDEVNLLKLLGQSGRLPELANLEVMVNELFELEAERDLARIRSKLPQLKKLVLNNRNVF